MTKCEFERTNERRLALIGRRLMLGLTSGETAELGQLQAVVEAELARRFPLDIARLDALEAQVRELKEKTE
jgi:hypothetical protein